jgi:hypothetical protein
VLVGGGADDEVGGGAELVGAGAGAELDGAVERVGAAVVDRDGADERLVVEFPGADDVAAVVPAAVTVGAAVRVASRDAGVLEPEGRRVVAECPGVP